MKEAVILGNGCSLREHVRVPHATYFGVNRSWELFPETDYWVTADAKALGLFLTTYHDPMPSVYVSRAATRLVSQICPMEALKLTILDYEELSGGLAMRLAAEWGFTVVHLVGFDGGHLRFYECPSKVVRRPNYERAQMRVMEQFPDVEWLRERSERR
jgi:hypothetical protein